MLTLTSTRALLASALWGVCLPIYASVVTLNFNSSPGIYLYDPYYEDGFRVYSQPVQLSSNPDLFVQGHYDMSCGPTGELSSCGQLSSFFPNYDGTPFLGSDPTGARLLDADGHVVAGQSSPSVSHIRIDRFGMPFSVLDFQGFSGGLLSSKGGIAGGGQWDTVSVSGDLWRDVEWVELLYSFLGSPTGIDNLRVEVPEPPTLVLLGLGLAGLVFTRHRTQWSPDHQHELALVAGFICADRIADQPSWNSDEPRTPLVEVHPRSGVAFAKR